MNAAAAVAPTPVPNAARIQPWAENPRYWQLNGQPVFLIGGTVEDNVFQIPDLEAHLRLLASLGGNYARCTLSSRDPGDVWPFHRDPDTGRYDLEQPTGGFYDRLAHALSLSAELGIVLQFELFDRFDFARDPWQDNPFNPQNNSNYTAAESGLPERIDSHPGKGENPFFRTPPALEDNALVRRYQERFLDAVLALSLPRGNVLYCVSNETEEDPAWGAYWADYVRAAADRAGLRVCLTEMWDDRVLTGPQHRHTYGDPGRYDFLDASQNNHQTGQTHWDNFQAYRQLVADAGFPGPINSVKIYGANSGRYGTTRDAQERIWRLALGGAASVRFHRPEAGIGLAPIAQDHISSLRRFWDHFAAPFACTPMTDRIGHRAANEAYAMGRDPATPGDVGEYGLFFPDGGNVRLDLRPAGLPAATPATVHWLDIRNRWFLAPQAATVAPDGQLPLVTPREEGYWAAHVVLGG